MAFAPFDGVLLDEPRDPIPGAAAIQLHHRVERELCAHNKRPVLNPKALRDRAAACQALLGQGLLPEQLLALERHGLFLGNSKDPQSLASLIQHFDRYLQAVDQAGYIEPSKALWRAVDRHLAGGHGFWIERQEADGPLETSIQDLAPPRLRALCALPALGTIRFRLATRRGSGAMGLFAGREPHLVRQLLPALENLAVERGIDHFELDAPEGWASNPWGEALDGLFEGPLKLEKEGAAKLQRALLPTEAAVWHAAVEQIQRWVQEGIPESEITLIHPDPASLGSMLRTWLAEEGVSLRVDTGPALKQTTPWASLWALVVGLRDGDPAQLAAGLGSAVQETGLARSLRSLAASLEKSDQAGSTTMDQAYTALPDEQKAWLKDRWSFLRSLPDKVQALPHWLRDLEALASRLELISDGELFYPALGLLKEFWGGDETPLSLAAMADCLESSLDLLQAPDSLAASKGVRLLAPASLENRWQGSKATLILDLGEGAWPMSPVANPQLDWPRLLAINAALRAQAAAGEGCRDFSPRLQCFALPQAEEGESLPRAFHREAYAFNRALALTSRHLVALSAQRDSQGQSRSQGPFWQALEGAATWLPPTDRAASRLYWRWEAAESDVLTQERQSSVTVTAPDPESAMARHAPPADHMVGAWRHGLTETQPASPTLLEGLARCPFRVHAGRNLKLESWDEGDAHVLHVGSLTHKLMESLLKVAVGSAHWPSTFLEHYGIQQVCTAEFHGLIRNHWNENGDNWLQEIPGLSETEIQRLHLSLEESLPTLARVLLEDLLQSSPDAKESEGLDLPDDLSWKRELLGLELQLSPRELTLPNGEHLWVKGAVDRLEKWVSGKVSFLRIVDYKTSSRSNLAKYRENDGAFGAHLQLPVYQLLVEAEHGLPSCAVLMSLKEEGKPIPMCIPPKDTEGRTRLLGSLQALQDRAQGGEFPATPGEHCATCTLSALCGRPVDVDYPETEGESE